MSTISHITWAFLSFGNSSPRAQGHNLLLHIVGFTNTPLDCWPGSNSVDPLEQVRKRLHLVLREAGLLPALYPRPSPNISDRVFPLPIAGEIVAWLAGEFAGKAYLQDAVYAEGLVLEPLDRVCIAERCDVSF